MKSFSHEASEEFTVPAHPSPAAKGCTELPNSETVVKPSSYGENGAALQGVRDSESSPKPLSHQTNADFPKLYKGDPGNWK